MSTTTLSHEIADTLRTEILRQQYRSGERLPSERDLAARFSASRGAVREALSQLDQLGLISIQPGGVRVKPIEEASISILGPLLSLSDTPNLLLVDQFLQTFAAMSALNAREALTVANTEQLAQMRTMVAAVRKSGAEVAASQKEWVEFMEYLAEVADNLVVRLIGNDLKAQFVNRMVKEELKITLKKKAVADVVQSLNEGLETGDRDIFSNAVLHYFDQLRAAVIETLNQRLAI
jgi:DNA-binding FadR family transcriptional regulator